MYYVWLVPIREFDCVRLVFLGFCWNLANDAIWRLIEAIRIFKWVRFSIDRKSPFDFYLRLNNTVIISWVDLGIELQSLSRSHCAGFDGLW